jgi:hypothetical protein
MNDTNDNTTIVATTPLTITTAVQPQHWIPGIDANNDNLVDIEQELLPFRLAELAEFEGVLGFSRMMSWTQQLI